MALLPVHGFVLAGGKSSRMGRDKALLSVQGKPMIGTAVEKMRRICTAVAICGNRDDLSAWAPVVREARVDVGPAAGLEAGLQASEQPWSLFIPVDVPCVPEQLLLRWARQILGMEEEGVRLSYLEVGGERQPGFCLLHRSCLAALSVAVDQGQRKLETIFQQVASSLGNKALRITDASEFSPESPWTPDDLQQFFRNINTPQDVLSVESAGNPGAGRSTLSPSRGTDHV